MQKTKIFRVVALLVAMLCVVAPFSAVGQSISMREVRDMAKSAKTLVVEQDLVIEGFVISKPGGANNDINVSVHFRTLANNDLSTVYVESIDGDVGFKLKVAERPFVKLLPRYSRVKLSLKGTTLKYSEPCCVTIEGVRDTHIIDVEQGDAEDLPRKEKYISELTDDDIYTYVTLKDCEFVFKDGSYSNVYERYVLKTKFNGRVKPNRTMDCWPSLLCDKNGDVIYSLVNSLCHWRRDGEGVPKGSGPMKGIISHATLPRYGGDVLGRYSIIPMDRGDYDEINWAPSTSKYRTIAEWHWNNNKKEFATEYEDLAIVYTDKILADVGKGTVQLEVSGEAIRGRDTNNPRVDAGKEAGTIGFGGFVRYGALCIKTEAHNWWDWKNDCGKGVEVAFSTKGMSGKQLIFGFTFAAGEISAQTSYGYPVFWNVEYSTDGRNWTPVEGSQPKKLRSLPWHWDQKVHDIHYDSVLAGIGYTEHMVVLPSSLFGKPKVYVRVVPVAKNTGTLGYDYNENGALRHNSKEMTVVNFGSFVVRYN